MLNASKYLRISVTSQCNLACYYCHHEGNFTNAAPRMTPEDLKFVCEIALEKGFTKFKLTGGEPTLRPDICAIIENLSRLNLPDLSMITNGTRLSEIAPDLWRAGLRRLNVTLNTIAPDKFRKIQQNKVHVSLLEKTLAGIDAAQRAGFKNIKLNFVYCDERSRRDLVELLEYAKNRDCILVVLPVIEGENFYTLEGMHDLIRQFGVSGERAIVDAEGIRKRIILLENGARVLLRDDELSERKPYVFCKDCPAKRQCREGIFPIRLSAQGQIIPCMAGLNHRLDIIDAIKNRDGAGVREAFDIISAWYSQQTAA